MSTCIEKKIGRSLELPQEFEDLTGLLHADLRAIVTALAQRAQERLLLSSRQAQRFQAELWDELTRSIDRAVSPHSADRR